MALQGPSMWSFTKFSKFSLCLLMLTVKKYHYNCRWNSLIFSVQKIWSPSFLLATSLISIRNTCFHVDDTSTISPTLSILWVFLALPKWCMPRACCIGNCQNINCLRCSFYRPLHLTLISHIFVIADSTTCLINKLWLLPSEFS